MEREGLDLTKTRLSWDQDLVLPAVAAVMASAFVALFLSILRTAFPAIYVLPFYPFILLLISAESVLTTKLLFPIPDERMGFRLREWLSILVVLRVVFYFEGGISWGEVMDSLRGLRGFLPRPFLINSASLYLSWWLASVYMNDIIRIQMIPRKYPPPSDNEGYSEWRANVAKYFNHRSILESISRKFLFGGIVMVVALAILWHISIRRQEGHPAEYTYALIASFVYFTSGLVLVNGVYHLKVRIDWMRERIASSPLVSPNWMKASLLAILAICGLGLLLPANYSPLSWDRMILILFDLMARLAALFSRLFTFAPPDRRPPDMPPPLPPEGGSADFREPSLFEIVLAILYILMFILPILLLLVGLVVGLVYILQSREMPEGGVKEKLLWLMGQYKILLIQVAGAMWGRLCSFNPFRVFFRRLKTQEEGRPLGGGGFTQKRKYRGSDARQRELVADMYLAFIHLASASGCPHYISDTPHEYSRRVADRLPVDPEHVGYLTDSFVRKRYSSRPLSREEMQQAKSCWRRVRVELERLKGRKRTR